LDLFVVADAVLISLACMLVFIAYREINAAPVRHAEAMAVTVLAVADDFSGRDPLDSLRLDDSGQFGLANRLAAARKQIARTKPGVELSLYSEHPNFAQISEDTNTFLSEALAKFRQGAAEVAGKSVRNAKANYFWAVSPLRATRDCIDCEARGYTQYNKGDIIGLRTVKVVIGDEYARIIGMLLYAFAILAAALMCVLGIIFPMLRRVRHERSQMNDLAVSYEKQATTDALTGLSNRRYFEQALRDYLRQYGDLGKPIGLLVFDLDRFKQINDTHGHDAGDQVLKQVAGWLKAITRESDVVARIGGEEFAVIAPNARHAEILVIAERYRETIGSVKVDLDNGVVLRPTISVGAATSADGVTDPAELFKIADEKLYQAKRAGRNRVAA